MTQPQPPITRTTHTLPFDKLSPRDFERLCLWLVEREGYERAEHLGAAGSEQGRDIVAWSEGALWAFQCKRVRSFGPKDALAEVEKVLALSEAERPVGLVFLVICNVSANTRQQVRERCVGEMECAFWAGTELDEKVKQHPDIVEEFFTGNQARTETTVSATVSHITDSTVITAGCDVIIYEGTKPVSIGALLDACQAQVESVLYDVRHKYDPKLYVNRAIERDLNEFFDTPLDGPAPNCFLIVAPAGSGKTNLLCELARLRVLQQPVLLLMGGNLYIGATTGLPGAIQSELQAANAQILFRSAEDGLHTLHRLAEELDRDALLFLDAINEHDRPVPMRKAVKDLLRKTRGRRIKLVVTCRDYYWGLFKGRSWEGATVNALPVEADEEEDGDTDGDFSRFAADEHERALPLYLDHYQITGRPVGDAAEQCRHPLLLRFFCEAYRGQDVGEVEDIRLKELFDCYWDQKLASIAERMIQQGDERLQNGLAADVGDYLLNVAAHMLYHNVRAIPLAEISQATGREEQCDDPRSVYGRIRDEFIILEEKERGKGQRKILQVAFVYEEFMEYVMACSLLRDWDRANLDEAAILAEIETLTGKYKSFAQILGVMVYLALMLREERDLALWSLLLNKGKRWQKVVFEAFRKLPEEQLDAKVFDALREMLNMGDESIQKQVLDTLKVKRVGRAAPTSMVTLVSELATHEQESVARRAVLALGNTTEANLVLPVLTEAISDSKRRIRENAITALGRLGDERALEPLIAALKGTDRGVQETATKALVELLLELGPPAIITALKGTDRGIRETAIVALEKLGKLRDARAVKPLIVALKDSDEEVRRRAASVLGELGDAWAVEPLIVALKGSDEKVQQKAAEALGKLGEPAVGPLVAALKDGDANVPGYAAWALFKVGKSAVGPLIAALKNSDTSMRFGVALVLSQLGEPAVEPLIAALGDSDQHMRSGAAFALGWLRDARAVEPLIAALKDGDKNVRSEAAKALGMLGDARAVEPLIAALKDGDKNVRSEAAEALRCVGTPRARITVMKYKVQERLR